MSLARSTEVERNAISTLRDARTIRERCESVFSSGLAGKLEHFEVNPDALAEVASRVVTVTRRDYPDLEIPVHGRWRHFGVGEVDRLAALDQIISTRSPIERARCHVDLVVVSVLLDAGAGAQWFYRDGVSEETFVRSEGLAVASFDTFMSGCFSGDPGDPFRVDATGLGGLTEEALSRAFQVSAQNPLAGISGRVALLQALSRALSKCPEVFGKQKPRVGTLVDRFVDMSKVGATVRASHVLRTLLDAFESIWPSGLGAFGTNLGDVGRHPCAGGVGVSEGFVPFHKLSQWLTYSLIEPLALAGVVVEDLDALTGLPEYRNGGLFVDGGVLVPRHEAIVSDEYDFDSEPVVEWRALTVALLDRLRDEVAQQLELERREFPVARMLQGGTWQAGRELALELRSDGGPPIRVRSDGTVF